MADKKSYNVSEIINSSACFDLQFRKDTRHERTGSPTYYRWKAQFVVTLPKISAKSLEHLKKQFGCGKVSVTGNQARFSVQNINEICESIIPYLKKNPPGGAKKKDFELWARAAEIICGNKGIALAAWAKNDLKKLLEIHRVKHQTKTAYRPGKWLDMAKAVAKSSV